MNTLQGAAVRKGYKKTAVGVIPEEWECVTVEEFIQPHKSAMKIGPFGSSLKKEIMVASGIKVYGQENIFEQSMEYGDRYISQEHYEKLMTCELFPGDFIISMMGTIGKCMVVPKGIKKGIMDSHLLRLQLNSKLIDPNYLKQIFRSVYILDQVDKLAVGGIMAGLSSRIVKQIQFILPPLPEQKKIAEILSTVDEKIDLIEQQITQTTALKKGLMQRLLTRGIGHTEFKDSELGRIPREWVVKRLGDISNVVRGGSPRPAGSPLLFNGNYMPWITVAELTNIEGKYVTATKTKLTELGATQTRILESDTVVLANSGATLGVPRILKIRGGANDGVAAFLNLQEVINDYLYYYLQSLTSFFREQLAPGSGQPNLNTTLIGGTKIGVPPLPEQYQIATILTTVDEKLETLQLKKESYQLLKKSLMQKLLTGTIRVPLPNNPKAA